MVDFEADAKWIWAAYKRGEANFAPALWPAGMSNNDSDLTLWQILNQENWLIFMMEAEVGVKGRIPVGLAQLIVYEGFYWLHFEWFWWASPRNKIESTLKFLRKMGEDYPMLMAVEIDKPIRRTLEHMMRYGLVKRIGVSQNWGKTPYMLFESRAD